MLMLRLCHRLYIHLSTSKFIIIRFTDSLAVTVEGRSKFYRKLLDMKISIDYAALLQCQSILDIDITFNLTPKIYICAEDITLDHRCLTDNDTALRLKFALKCTGYRYIAR